jgi:hypothetical protein
MPTRTPERLQRGGQIEIIALAALKHLIASRRACSESRM